MSGSTARRGRVCNSVGSGVRQLQDVLSVDECWCGGAGEGDKFESTTGSSVQGGRRRRVT